VEDKNKECRTSCCGGGQVRMAPTVRPGGKTTAEGVPQVDAPLTLLDRWGGWKMRLGIGRGRYREDARQHRLERQGGDETVSIEASQKVTAGHLKRSAYLYVRQSTMRQVFENTESTERQYALRQRAVALGRC